MSSHRRSTQYFSRKYNARKALIRGLIVSLVEHERIKTTVEKAKELRRHVEKAITLGKKDDLATRRLLMSRIPNQDTVGKIVTDLSKRFGTRPGGYTRIIKIGRRPGDQAEMAFIEFVDYDWKKAGAETETKAVDAKVGETGEVETKKKKTAKKATTKAAGKTTKSAKKPVKKVAKKKAQKKARKSSRAK